MPCLAYQRTQQAHAVHNKDLENVSTSANLNYFPHLYQSRPSMTFLFYSLDVELLKCFSLKFYQASISSAPQIAAQSIR